MIKYVILYVSCAELMAQQSLLRESSPVPVPASQANTYTLEWKYPQPWGPNIVFDVECNTNARPFPVGWGNQWYIPTNSWKSFTNIQSTVVPFKATSPSVVFRVRARDTSTGLASKWTSE